MLVNLAEMKSGQAGVVVSLEGGHASILRMQNLGIRPGKRITKLSANFLRGPVTVQIGQTNVALGFGMASKVIVELEKEKHK